MWGSVPPISIHFILSGEALKRSVRHMDSRSCSRPAKSTNITLAEKTKNRNSRVGIVESRESIVHLVLKGTVESI